MNRKILINFCKDNFAMTIAFFLNGLLIMLFYYISTGSSVEILYPFTISLFIYLVFILTRWFKYYRFNSNLSKCVENMHYDNTPSTCEQKEVIRQIMKTHQSYMDKIYSIGLQNSRQKHFISQWIHNMKTPVSVIDLIIQRIISGEITLGDALKDLREENERLIDNLEQVLSILRLDEFSRDYVPESIDLVALVRKVINNRKNQFIYNRVFPKLQTSSDSLKVLTDSKWNEVLIDQIVSNAIKYSEAGEAGKNVYFIIETQNGMVSLVIKDEGIGIPEYDMKRVFDPFFTGENGRKYKNSTGIGLYICTMIAEKLGARLNLKSKVGVGTEVSITYLSKL